MESTTWPVALRHIPCLLLGMFSLELGAQSSNSSFWKLPWGCIPSTEWDLQVTASRVPTDSCHPQEVWPAARSSHQPLPLTLSCWFLHPTVTQRYFSCTAPIFYCQSPILFSYFEYSFGKSWDSVAWLISVPHPPTRTLPGVIRYKLSKKLVLNWSS